MLVYGGVRRYIELGNEFVSRGHEFIIYTPDGKPPDWLAFFGSMRRLDSMPEHGHDVILNGSPEYASYVDRGKARLKIFYIQGENVLDEREIITSGRYRIMVNSSGLRKKVRKRYSIDPIDGIGGINQKIFNPGGNGEAEVFTGAAEVFTGAKESNNGRAGAFDGRTGSFKVLCYGRLSRPHKGTRFVIQAVRSMLRKGCDVELHLFDYHTQGNPDPRIGFQPGVPFTFYMDLPQSAMAAMYRAADVFVSAEHRTGWCNTGVEAVACGLPLVCTRSGTEDFAINNVSALVVPYRTSFFVKRALTRLYHDRELGVRLGEEARGRISEFTWGKVCDKMERSFVELTRSD